MVLSLLRSIEPSISQQVNAVSRLQRAGFDARLSLADGRERMLQLRISTEQQEFEAHISIASWFSLQFPDWQTLAWSEADEDTLLDLFNAVAEPLDWEQDWLPGARIRAVGVTAISGQQIALSSAQGWVYCQHLPETLWPAASPAAWVQALPVPLVLRLGQLLMPPALLSGMEVGDVLLLPTVNRQLVCHGLVLFNYSIQQEKIMLEQVMDAGQVATIPLNPLQASRQIPLPVELVLQEMNMSVAQLEQLSVGQVLTLNADAERNVLLRANGVLLARGELVEVNQQLGVQITQLLLNA
jgi:type III secretion protein Q